MPQPPQIVETLQVVRDAAVPRTRRNGKKWRLEPFWCVRGTASFLTTLERFYNLRGLRHLQLTFYASSPKKGEGGEPRKLTRSRRDLKILGISTNFEIAPWSRELRGLTTHGSCWL